MGSRIGALILCLVGGLAAALILKHAQTPIPPAVLAAPSLAPAALTAGQIFAAIPLPEEDSMTDKALAQALTKLAKNRMVPWHG